MRVIAGTAGGRTLKVVSKARPYLEKVRGAIFNSLTARVPDARVLDLYAGSGAAGIEALSRGAEKAVFVEADRASANIIKDNLESCDLAARAEIKLMTVADFLRLTADKFSLIFIDPPFTDDSETKAAYGSLLASAAAVLEPDGRIVFRQEVYRTRTLEIPGLEIARDKEYGRSRVTIYRPGAADSGVL